MTTSPASELLSERRGDAHLLVVNRPHRRNAITPDLARRLADAIDEIGQRDDLRAVLLAGAGGEFCAGLDLHWLAGLGAAPPVKSLQTALAHCQQAVLALVRCPLPVIALLDGLVAGYGLALALAADHRIAAPDARFLSGYARLGLVPGGGLTFALPRLVGRGRAMRILMGGAPLDVETACAMGLVDTVAETGMLWREADALTADLARSPAATLRTIKRLCRGDEIGALDQALSMEGALLLQSLESDEFRDRLLSYTERSLDGRPFTATEDRV